MTTSLRQNLHRLQAQKTDPLLAAGLSEDSPDRYPSSSGTDTVLGAMEKLIDEAQLMPEELPQSLAIENGAAEMLVLTELERPRLQLVPLLAAAPPSKDEETAIANQVRTLLQQGDGCLMENQVEEAIAHYRQAVELAPDSIETHQYLAEALTQQGQLEAAAQHYSQALELTTASAKQGAALPFSEPAAVTPPPIESFPWYEQGAFYLQQSEVYTQQEQWQAVITHSRKALEHLGSRSALAYRLLGRALQEEKQLDEATEAYQAALALQPDLPENHARMGSLLTEQDSFTEAIRYYQQAIALDPKFAGAYLKLGEIWQKLGDEPRAVECFYQAVKLRPDWISAEDYLRLGNRLSQQKKFAQAIDCYQQAIAFEPSFAEAYYQLAMAAGHQGDWQRAVEYHQQATQKNPISVQFQAGLGRSLAQLEQWQAAINCYQQILALQPEPAQQEAALRQLEHCQRAMVATSYENMANNFARQQQWQEAITCYRLAVERHPDGAKAQAGLGRALAATQQWQEALGCYQAALRVEPQHPEYRKGIAAVLLQLGRFEEAANYYRQLVDGSAKAAGSAATSVPTPLPILQVTASPPPQPEHGSSVVSAYSLL